MWEISLNYFTFSTQVFTKAVYVLEMLNLPGKNDFIHRRQILTLDEQLESSTSKLPQIYQPIKLWPNWAGNLSILEDRRTS